jgi:sugar/nucleoside kinase (ribokinase family)
MSAPPVVVIGDVMTDVWVRPAGPIAPATDTLARIALRPGGSAANTAAWLGSIGVPVVMLGCVGDDAAGRHAAEALRAAGAEPRLAVARGVATGACVVLVDDAGERTMLPDAGANARLPDRPLPAARHLHVSGYALLRPRARAAAVAALCRAAHDGVPTSVDAASAAPLRAAGPAAVRALARGARLLMVTLDEAAALTGTRDPEAAGAALLADHAEVVLKLGADGALWRARDGRRARVPAAAPDGPVVDTTGAGDAFAAGWLAGGTPAERLRRATALAARAVTREGARP